jgi:putative phage-type endonuclease
MEAHLIQGTPEWKNLRLRFISATDVSAILGISPYKTSRDLYLDKRGEGKPFITNPAVERGKAIEPELRRWYEDLKGCTYEDKVVMHPYNNFAMASLDGISRCGKHLLEIKTVGKDVFLKAQNGQLPDYFVSQGQWQLFCCPLAIDNTFLCEWKNEKCLVTVARDDLYISKVSAICEDWYNRYLIGDEEPPLSDKDYLNLSGDLGFSCVAAEARVVHESLKELESQWKAIKQRLLDCTDGLSAKGCGITITNSTRKGTVDTEKLAADLDIDLDKYRKPSSTSVTIRVNLKFEEGAGEG